MDILSAANGRAGAKSQKDLNWTRLELRGREEKPTMGIKRERARDREIGSRAQNVVKARGKMDHVESYSA